MEPMSAPRKAPRDTLENGAVEQGFGALLAQLFALLALVLFDLPRKILPAVGMDGHGRAVDKVDLRRAFKGFSRTARNSIPAKGPPRAAPARPPAKTGVCA